VGVSRSPLLPLFRSDTQLGVLTELFCGADDELMISAAPLTELLDRTTGPAGAVAEAFASVEDVESVWIFGSWAARRHGIAGAAPHDIDVVVIGTPGALAVSRAALAAEKRIRVPVNPVIVERDDWDVPEPGSFLAHVKSGPLVGVIDAVPLHA